jgi:hypothetical protein
VLLDVQEVRVELYICIAAIFDMIQTNLTGVLAIGHGQMPIIKVTSPNTVTGLRALEDALVSWKRPRCAGSDAFRL